jgi:hypothetical protein
VLVSAGNPKSSFKPGREQADTSSMDDDNEPVKSGRVRFDDRGNAIWEWAMATGAFGRDVADTRVRGREHPGLAIVDDGPAPSETTGTNRLGLKKGYDPYDSGQLAKERISRKKDLRKLSEWLKLKKQAEANKTQDDPE